MAFEVLQKSPQVAPLLVRLYDTHNLYSLAEHKGEHDSCRELTAIMVDLLNVPLSDNESELITDVLLGLMKQAEKDLRIALSGSLAGMERAPLRMILALANDEIEIAAPVLRHSPVLQDMDLAYILQSNGAPHGRPIAQRRSLSAALVNMLAETRDFEIAVNLSNNDGVALTERAFAIFTEMAKDNRSLATPLLSRDDVPREVAHALYDYVGEELKKTLIGRYGPEGESAARAVDAIVVELREPEVLKPGMADTLMAAAHNMMERKELKLSTIIAALRRGQYATFVTQLAVFFALPLSTVKAMMRQESGRGLALACRAMDVTKADFVSLYLLTERFRTNGKKMVSHKDLTRIMTMYDEINPDDAREIVKNSRN
ncbi:MAG: DUF2336 domain-containing protein [Micavibrio sp.]